MLTKLIKDYLFWKAMEIAIKKEISPAKEIREGISVLKVSASDLSEIVNLFNERSYTVSKSDLESYFSKYPLTENEVIHAMSLKREIQDILHVEIYTGT